MRNKGDILARGGSQATFQGPTREKEGTDVFREPGLQPIADEIDLGPVPGEDAPEPILPKAKPEVGYRGKPFGDNVMIQRVEREHTSNLILPDSLKSKSDLGYVVAIGNRVENVKEGQLCCFDRFAAHGSEFELIDESGIKRQYLLLREYDIMIQLERVKLD